MFRCHGRPRAVSLNGGTIGEGQWKAAVAIDPMPVPGSLMPPLSVPDMRAELQVRTEPVVVSFSAAFPAVAVMAPPGRTLHTVALAAAGDTAADDTAPAPAAKAKATARPPIRMRIQEPPPDRCASTIPILARLAGQVRGRESRLPDKPREAGQDWDSAGTPIGRRLLYAHANRRPGGDLGLGRGGGGGVVGRGVVGRGVAGRGQRDGVERAPGWRHHGDGGEGRAERHYDGLRPNL